MKKRFLIFFIAVLVLIMAGFLFLRVDVFEHYGLNRSEIRGIMVHNRSHNRVVALSSSDIKRLSFLACYSRKKTVKVITSYDYEIQLENGDHLMIPGGPDWLAGTDQEYFMFLFGKMEFEFKAE